VTHFSAVNDAFCSRDKPEPKLLERAVALLREMEAAVAKGTVAQADPMAYRLVVYALGKAGNSALFL
jgi:hypothetical protein